MRKDLLQLMPAIWCGPLSKHRLPPARHQPSLLRYTIRPNTTSFHSFGFKVTKKTANDIVVEHHATSN